MIKLISLLTLLISLCFFVNNTFQAQIPWSKLSTAKNINKYSYETKYFNTFLDHFSYRNYSATFKLRYIISQSSWKPGNAILFYCGNEGSIDVFVNNTGFVWELGKKLSAMVVFAEHRYYGESLPFGQKSFWSPEYFGYLSSEQALADYASLITYLKVSISGAESSAVIAFGGSYGGMLAAWLRQKYPNVVAGSLAASAPVLMVDNITGCNGALQVLTNAYKVKGSEACTRNVRRVWPIMTSMNSSNGLAILSKIFHTCFNLDDLSSFMSQIQNALFSMGMANYPYETSFLAPMPPWPVTEFCKPLANDIYEPTALLGAIFKGIQIYYNYTGKTECLPLEELNTNGLDADGWTLQTCTELPMPMCSNGLTDMFYKVNFDKESNDKSCFDQFGVKPRWGWGQIQFWSNKLQAASNIIFSNGLLDPWSAGGVFSSQSDSIKIITIPNGAHHLDLRGSDPKDPSDVRLARKIETAFIEKWINEWNL